MLMCNLFLHLAKPSSFVATIVVLCLLNLGGSDGFSSAISYNFTFTCDHPGTWCAEILMVELDGITTSEPWMYSSFCTNESSYEIFSETMRGGGDGLYQLEYEVSNYIFHNCTTNTHKSSYKRCKYNTIVNECWMFDRVADSNGTEHKCNCATAPSHRRIRIDTVQTYAETYNLTESTMEAYNQDNSDLCRYPKTFMMLQVKSPERFPRNLGSCKWNDEVPNTKFTFVKNRPRVLPCIPDETFRYTD